MATNLGTFPIQQLSYKAKTKAWRKSHVEWADKVASIANELVRKSVGDKIINYDLMNGVLNLDDVRIVLNPENIKAQYTQIGDIQHFPILNSKINLLLGEELKRPYNWHVTITNPELISEIETNKKQTIQAKMQEAIEESGEDDQLFELRMQEVNKLAIYEWLDVREIRANALLNHYYMELNMPLIFNAGFQDALTVGEEIYLVSIVGGEPSLRRINPIKIRTYMSGFSNKIEDADIIVIQDFWSKSRIVDAFYDVLSISDLKKIESVPSQGSIDSMYNSDPRDAFVRTNSLRTHLIDGELYTLGTVHQHRYHDDNGNMRVMQVYWKSRRKIKKIKSYDPTSGEESFSFYPETYIPNEEMGEEEQIFWINEQWEGVQIGKDVYCNMRPCVIQYNRLDNPSRCHAGIIGLIYNLNDNRPYSMVDMMKPYSYLYDVVHHKLSKAIANNYGKIPRVDLARIPKGWSIDKWLYFAKVNNLAVEDSFKEGNVGAAKGKIVGGFGQLQGVLDLETGNFIELNYQLLAFIREEMSEIVGISKLREGLISNRETVGGIERATLLSSHITEWFFSVHDDLKRRVLEAFIECSKACLKGRTMKFNYLLSDMSKQVVEIPGDEFAECDYGLVVENASVSRDVQGKVEQLAALAVQNLMVSMSTIMKVYNTTSLAQKERLIQQSEEEMQAMQLQQAEADREAMEQQANMQIEMEQMKMLQADRINQRDNDTKIVIALIAALSRMAGHEPADSPISDTDQKKLDENIRLFNEKHKLDKERLSFDKTKTKRDQQLKEKQINKQSKQTSK